MHANIHKYVCKLPLNIYVGCIQIIMLQISMHLILMSVTNLSPIATDTKISMQQT